MTETKLEPFMIHIVGRRRALTIHDPFGRSRILTHGQDMLITPEIVSVSTDSRGGCVLTDLLNDPEAQVRAFGEHLFAPGAWPADESRLLLGSPAHAEAREVARQKAHAEADPVLREAALAAVTAEFGRPPVTSRTLRSTS